MRFALTVEDAVRDADLAFDFVPDELESKLEIFSLIDRMAPPRTILCTPSEAVSITDLASCTYRGERCFAVRGDLGEGKGVRLLHPEMVSQDLLKGLEQFFTTLKFEVATEVDPDAPALLKNLKERG